MAFPKVTSTACKKLFPLHLSFLGQKSDCAVIRSSFVPPLLLMFPVLVSCLSVKKLN